MFGIDIYFKVFDELYDIIREGDEMAFCYFSSWAPGKMWSNKGFSSSRVTQQAITLLPPANIFLYKSYHFGEPPCGSPTPGVLSCRAIFLP